MRIRSTDMLVAALGALLAHEVAYGIVDLAGPAHGHLPTLLGVLVPLGGIVLARVAVRALVPTLPSARSLAVLQVACFLLLEGFEHAAIGGVPAMLANPAVLLGLLLQPIVAGVLHLTATHGRSLVARTTSVARFAARGPSAPVPRRPGPRVCSLLSRLPLLRGPPSLATT